MLVVLTCRIHEMYTRPMWLVAYIKRWRYGGTLPSALYLISF